MKNRIPIGVCASKPLIYMIRQWMIMFSNPGVENVVVAVVAAAVAVAVAHIIDCDNTMYMVDFP